jgi:cell division protein FtsB
MRLKKLRENKIFKVLSNKYFIIGMVFVVWMVFFDENSWLNHRELDEEIDDLENANDYYKNQIETDQKVIDNLKNPDSLEKFAREEYKMKKKNEDIFIVEYDTVEED